MSYEVKAAIQFSRLGCANKWQPMNSFRSWNQFNYSANNSGTGQSEPYSPIRTTTTNDVETCLKT